jgi:hypothetical protein
MTLYNRHHSDYIRVRRLLFKIAIRIYSILFSYYYQSNARFEKIAIFAQEGFKQIVLRV